MKIKMIIALLLCLSFVLLVGSAMADVGNSNSEQDTLSADTPSNNSENETNDMDDADEDKDDSVTDKITNELFLEEEDEGEETDDIPPFEGAVGPEHALYGLKIAFANIDETFTYNSSERLGKQVSDARRRISEARAEMEEGNDEAAGIAFEHYNKKIENIDATANSLDEDDPGLEYAQKMMLKHQLVLQNLIQQKLAQGKNVKGIMNAFNNSLRLEEKFQFKMEMKAQRGGENSEQMGEAINHGNGESNTSNSGSNTDNGESDTGNVESTGNKKGNGNK
ncbi:MAG: DUF5667 domain-containing protein [ANME-2 cluster archaeon]|nr:DUF5667 domain-containing protein [ANME-2 cluster archaeon]